MDALTIALLALAAFLGGGLNALAGGGTFFTFPALVMAGLPAIQASPTSAAAILPGYASAAFAYRRHFASDETLPAPLALAASIAGAVAGASILLIISAKAFDWIVPWLLLCATLLFVFDKTIGARLRGSSLNSVPARLVVVFAAGTYGGFFNGGLGIVLLAALRLVGLQRTDQAKLQAGSPVGPARLGFLNTVLAKDPLTRRQHGLDSLTRLGL
ncbi:MAG: sulfite exporter TauE/SafE family protein [Rhizobiales bacterium]|nr:sulfite exporter TauE/SafE family protein [Hyphomicrobiales bacterium]